MRLSAKYQKWKKEAVMSAAYERKGPRIEGCFVVRVIVPVGAKDANNNDKALLDALQAGTAITNDRLLRGYEVWQDTEQAPNFVLVQLWRVEELVK